MILSSTLPLKLIMALLLTYRLDLLEARGEGGFTEGAY
jgi:hypothetical protein